MADHLSTAQRSELMKAVKQVGTDVELIVRKGLHGRGLRYILADKRLPGRPDLTFPKYCAVVFVHGCYWHGHECNRGRASQSNTGYWSTKIEQNKARDARVESALRSKNWRVFVVWGCQLRSAASIDKTVEALAEDIRRGSGS